MMCMCIYIFIYIYTHTYIHVYRDREIERERDIVSEPEAPRTTAGFRGSRTNTYTAISNGIPMVVLMIPLVIAKVMPTSMNQCIMVMAMICMAISRSF